MKNFRKKILPGILVTFVMVGVAAWFYFGQQGAELANAGEEKVKVANNGPAKKSDTFEISTLLQKMNMSVAADHPVMPDFELLDLDGNAVRLSQFKGETVLLGFFTTW
jgi:hypothetical protein